MALLKHSRQRDSIVEYLAGTKEHPTADMVYANIREQFPNISLGTVYRNLSLLNELGQVVKITTPGQPDRFDYRTDPHYHFICVKCGRVIDLDIEDKDIGDIDVIAGKGFDGIVNGHICQFYGICPDCVREERKHGN